jgi:hypothetical protein
MSTTTVPRFTAGTGSAVSGTPGRPTDARYRDHEGEIPTGDFTTTEAELRELCATAVVGDRVHLTGPEKELLRAAALLRELGFDDAELTLTCTTPGSPFTDRDLRRVNCCHCHTVSVHPVAVGDPVDCPGCGRSLVVYHHFSRRTASYLAFTPEEES